MPRARKHLVCLADTPYYHVTSRCVRRAYLCGFDRYSGKSYEHRRSWIETRIRLLSSLFSINVCAYAVMSNHYHLVVHINPSETEKWMDTDVLERWTALFRGPLVVQQFLNGQTLSQTEQNTLAEIAAVYRQRLASLSWFMKCLNEPIARKANAEDRCTGHFWEARFHSQALKTDAALISAMAYVDLNPVRANIAKTPEDSDYTSIKARISDTPTHSELANAITELIRQGELQAFNRPIQPLMAFSSDDAPKGTARLPIRRNDYLQLVDITGRISQPGKRGQLDPCLTPILDRLGVSVVDWQDGNTNRSRARFQARLCSKRVS